MKKVLLVILLATVMFYYFYLNYFDQNSLRNKIEFERGYNITDQSQKIEVCFNFLPSWLPKKNEKVKELHQNIYNEHNTIIAIEHVSLTPDGLAKVTVAIKPTYLYKSGEFITDYIIIKKQHGISHQYLNLEPIIFDRTGNQLNNAGHYIGKLYIEHPKFKKVAPSSHFEFFIECRYFENNDPLLVKFSGLNLINYKKN